MNHSIDRVFVLKLSHMRTKLSRILNSRGVVVPMVLIERADTYGTQLRSILNKISNIIQIIPAKRSVRA